MNWLKTHWKAALVTFVAFWVGAALGASGQSTEDNEGLENENQALKEDVRQLEDEIERADATAEELESYRADAIRYRRNKTRIEQEARKAREAERERLAAEREQQRREREATERAAQSTIEDDGTWHAGEDFAPGTYRASGQDCYWARMTSPHGGSGVEDIIENGLGPSTVQINEGEWFQTSGCGAWEKIG
jgi:TolA-binding protein